MSVHRMKLFPFSPALLAALACALPFTGAALSVSTNRTFNVAPGGTLVIEADRGSIQVLTAETNAVSVTVDREINRSSDEKAQAVLDEHKLTFAEDAGTITVKARLPKTEGIWNRRTAGLAVKYTVTIPQRFNLTLETAGGNIAVANLTGAVRLKTAGGSIRVGKVDGPVNVNTAGGNITVDGATGAVEADSAGGSVKLGQLTGPATAETAGGSIRVDSAAAPLKASASGGSIVVESASAPLQLDTAGGSVTARFAGKPDGASSLQCAGGSIAVFVADGVGFDLDAESTGGSVRCELPHERTGKPNRNELRGRVAGGGPALKLRSVGGNISVRHLGSKKD